MTVANLRTIKVPGVLGCTNNSRPPGPLRRSCLDFRLELRLGVCLDFRFGFCSGFR